MRRTFLGQAKIHLTLPTISQRHTDKILSKMGEGDLCEGWGRCGCVCQRRLGTVAPLERKNKKK